MAPVFDSFKHKDFIEIIRSGGVGVLPTDTLYGLVCVASNRTSVHRLYGLKKRENKPGTIIASNVDQLVELGIKKQYISAVRQFWPGPVSVIVPTDTPTLSFLDQGKGSLAVRVVSNSGIKLLLDKTGPLLTSSANQPGEEPAQNIMQAQQYFGADVDFYVDGGNVQNSKPSTLVQIVDDTVDVLRYGAGSIESGKLKVER